jgi:hypothetical protein
VGNYKTKTGKIMKIVIYKAFRPVKIQTRTVNTILELSSDLSIYFPDPIALVGLGTRPCCK